MMPAALTDPSQSPSGSARRYARQTLVPQIGERGQAALGEARVVVIGVGALGGVQADLLARAGVGRLDLVDRDIVDETNLQRQTLFDEGDIGRPKAEAGAARLREINSTIEVRAHATDFSARSGEALLSGASAAVDGTDNLGTRFVINDLSVKLDVPWVYAAAVSTYGMVFPSTPTGPCFECVFPTEPPRGALATCDTVGVLNTLTQTIGAFAANLTLLRLVGEPIEPRLYSFEMLSPAVEGLALSKRDQCEACGERSFRHLAGRPDQVVELCGRDVLQVRPKEGTTVDLDAVAGRLASSVKTRKVDSVLQFSAEGHDVVVFADGRALVHGTEDPDRAKAIYARYIG